MQRELSTSRPNILPATHGEKRCAVACAAVRLVHLPGPPLSVVNKMMVLSSIPVSFSACVTFPIASSKQAIIPATIRRCCPFPFFVGGIVSLKRSRYLSCKSDYKTASKRYTKAAKVLQSSLRQLHLRVRIVCYDGNVRVRNLIWSMDRLERQVHEKLPVGLGFITSSSSRATTLVKVVDDLHCLFRVDKRRVFALIVGDRQIGPRVKMHIVCPLVHVRVVIFCTTVVSTPR